MQIDENGYWKAYQRVKENDEKGIASSENDLLLASIYSEKMCNKVFYNNEDSVFTDVYNKSEEAIYDHTFAKIDTKLHDTFFEKNFDDDFDDFEDTDINSDDSNTEFKKIEDLTDEELLTSVQTFTKAVSMMDFYTSGSAKNIELCLLAHYAEGLSRNRNFFEGMEEDIKKGFNEIKDKIAELEEQESKLFDNEESSKFIEEIFGDEDNDIDSEYSYKSSSRKSSSGEDNENDSEYSYLACHIKWLLGLSNDTKLSRFANGSYGDTMFDLRMGGKIYLARYKKPEDGSEKVYIDKGKGNFEEQIFDNEGKLREKTVKTGNKTVKKKFFENGVKFKTTTENFRDGSIKINKERRFPDGTIMKYEKKLNVDYDNTDKKNNFTFNEDKVKGTYFSVNQDGEKTGESMVEITQETKPPVKKDTKTVKISSKSNLKS